MLKTRGGGPVAGVFRCAKATIRRPTAAAPAFADAARRLLRGVFDIAVGSGA
jgi:hypothetical protein